MSNISINLEKKAVGPVGTGRFMEMTVCWLRKCASDLCPTFNTGPGTFPIYIITNRCAESCINSPCQGHSPLEVKSLKEAEVFDVLGILWLAFPRRDFGSAKISLLPSPNLVIDWFPQREYKPLVPEYTQGFLFASVVNQPQ